VIIPNYNYAQYLASRIDSVLSQTYPIYELIILDDASTDGSLSLINEIIAGTDSDCRLIVNEENSGSVFHQWAKGAFSAKGDLIWIAEADDLSDENFLATVVTGFTNSNVVMSYSESKQVDESGRLIGSSYGKYTEEVSSTKWLSNYIANGSDEVKEALSIKNTIPNVSAVLFDASLFKRTIESHLDQVLSLRFTGDWLFYAFLLEHGDIAFFSEALNIHRRHSGGVTLSDSAGRQCEEIRYVQKLIGSKYSLSDDIRKAANDYINKLADQFGHGTA
jgi:glycosyltransferase involved in cell wall biosynthesis